MDIKLKAINSANVILEAEVNGEVQQIMWKAIENAVPGFKKKENEGFWFDVFGKYVIGIIRIAQGQGNFIVGWDTDEKKIVHVSNGEFAERVFMHDGYVYSVCEVCCYGVKAHLAADRVEFGTMDRWGETESLNCVETDVVNSLNTMANYDLVLKDGNVSVVYDGKIYKIKV